MRRNSDNERSFGRKEPPHHLMRNESNDKNFGRKEHPLMRNESSEWNGKPSSARAEKQSPRHKPRPLMERAVGDWCDQMEEWEAPSSQPSVPTALVSPRKVEESLRPGQSRPQQAAVQTSPSRQQVNRQKQETNNHPYGVEPPPFKETTRSQPQPQPLLQAEAANPGWKCPDPGCKQVNGPNTNNCSQCNISFKVANDYINNYASEKVKQEYTKNTKTYSNISPSPSTQSNGYQASSNPSIPQPMLAQSNMKDWNLDVEQHQQQSTWPAAAQPLTTSIDSWGNLEPAMMYTTMDPGMQYGMMVPSYPPPFYNQPQPFYNPPANTDYFPQSSDFTPGYQQNNMTVFNPSAQMFIPPPPFSNNQKQNLPPSKPQYPENEPGLMISLNKPPNPLSLRRPQQTSRLQERLNQNRQSQDRERGPTLGGRTANGELSRGSGRLQKHRDAQHKPPSMVEMQSGVLKKGGIPPPPPGKGNGLLIFGSSPVDESFLNSETNIPVKFISCAKLEIFREKSSLLNPSRDWLVLVNGLGNDARIIAMTNKSDVDKANDADNVANDFCDVIENKILGVASHICVLVSMLLPRIDLQEAQGMGNPNNVRKVINVQITQRLYENPRVTLMNSDKILDWGDNDVLLNQLIRPDGFSLTDRGENLVYANWVEYVKRRMKDSNYVPNSSKQTNQVNPIKREESLPEPERLTESNLAAGAEAEEAEEDEDVDTVNDPFGSYEAPPVLVSRPRTVSTSCPTHEDTELDDDALPNLEPVSVSHAKLDDISVLGEKVNNITVNESPEKNGVPEFDLDNGGFIEDNYCGSESGDKNEATLPSMMSLGVGPASDDGKVSGHFLEDSYLPPEQALGARKTVELSFESSSSPVKIAGDFNNWTAQDMETTDNKVWRFLLDLPEGRYQYKYIVSGEWLCDENKPTCEKDGVTNNVLEIIC